MKIGFLPFALSLSKGYSWFDKLTTNGDKPVLSKAEGLTTIVWVWTKLVRALPVLFVCRNESGRGKRK